MSAREWLDGQMYSLVSLKIMITIKALRALITLEWAISLWSWSRRWGAINALHASGVSAVEASYDSMWHTSDHYRLAVWIMDI
jgi:hypothetical protein